MNDFPTLIVLTDQEHLVAYRPAGSAGLEPIVGLEPMEGNETLSDLVTDQAETFPTDDPGTSAYESMPLGDELEIRSRRQVAGKIEEILEREEPATWGFAASPDLNEAILDLLSERSSGNLTINLSLDLTHSPPAQVRARFEEALHSTHLGPRAGQG